MGGGPGAPPMSRGKSGQLRPMGGKSSGQHEDGGAAAAAAAAAAHHGEAMEKLRDELAKMREDRDSAVQLRQVNTQGGWLGCGFTESSSGISGDQLGIGGI